MELSDTNDEYWSQLIDDTSQDWPEQSRSQIEQPGHIFAPQASTDAAVAAPATIPLVSTFASTSSQSASASSSKKSANNNPNPNGNGRWPGILALMLLALLLLGGAATAITGQTDNVLNAVGIEVIQGPIGEAGQDGLDGRPGVDGLASNAVGTQGPAGQNGAAGSNGQNGNAGANGANGTNGTDGTNACISGLCVSRQASSPATQETGNINIDGAMIANNIGLGTSGSTARLAFASSTANTGGLAFGTDTLLYRTAAGGLRLEHVSGNNARLYFSSTHFIGDDTNNVRLEAGANQILLSGTGGDILRGYGVDNTLPAITVTPVAANQIGLATKAFSGQTANLQEWQDSTGTRLSAVDSTGTFRAKQGQTGVNGISFYDSNFAIGMSGTDLAINTVSGASNGISFTNGTVMSTPIMRILGNGNVGIGQTAPTVKLHVESTADETVLRLKDSDGTCDLNPESGSLTTSCSSDERLKTNIREAASVLSEIQGLKIHDYTVIASGTDTTGLVAQEVLTTNPEMVHMGEDGYYKVDQYNSWKMLKAIQELDTRTNFLTDDFTAALQASQGDIAAAKTQLSTQGLQIEQINQALVEFAAQLSSHDARIQSLEARVQTLEQSVTTPDQTQ